ncbi:mitochondrial carrier [Trichodelitschia bisporula]|uniref:Mitochondrial carrier n=1 Tax=Trichodelitschia bisporula TaxID=703511 RepID=A0A6G1HMZ1_9PEZI|nr:mitochondrial carrier [Trichodelitschia bisporula]
MTTSRIVSPPVKEEHSDGKDGPGKSKNSAATGASAASIRAVSAQVVAFYFRAPAKAFFRTRVDYMAYARAINPLVQSGAAWSWQTTTLGLLAHAVKTHGWSFIPNQVLPPLIANVSVGAVLYTSYLQVLGRIHEPSSHSVRRTYPPPYLGQTFAAGFMAGSIQSVIAAPLDAIQIRFRTSEMLEGPYKSMWHYSAHKLHSIGLNGIFAGWSLALIKDSLGCALFFSAFEYTKAQMYYGFLTRWYGSGHITVRGFDLNSENSSDKPRPVIRPYYLIEPAFLLAAGVTASIAQQVVQHPLTEIQNVHFSRLESLDYASSLTQHRRNVFRLYYHAYEKTFEQCDIQAKRVGGWRTWLYKGFLLNTLKQVPSTSAGLIVFEIVRRKYAQEADVICIQKDGYDILLT